MTEFKNKKVAVLGIGVSNLPLIDYLCEQGAKVVARDRKSREALGDIALGLEAKNVKLVLGDGYLDDLDEEVIFRSPGIRYDKPEIAEAVANGAFLTSEMELFFELCPAKIIGITGSDGKTTTTTLIHKILEADGKRSWLGGNIGTPLLPFIPQMREGDYAVVELSSFQLHTMKRSPDISVITNITPNHLDYHTGMDEYSDAKMNIVRYQDSSCRAVFNAMNEITLKASGMFASKSVLFSSGNVENADVKTKNGAIYAYNEKIIDIADILLPGKHNVENYMAAISALYGIVSLEAIKNVAMNFAGVEHRLELVRVINGVKYYNSSIDTSPTRTAAALGCFDQKVIAILGGYDKHIPFEPLAKPLCERTRAVVITGATQKKIKDALICSDEYKEGYPEIYESDSFEGAVMTASSIAHDGDVVILTPACASFDAFVNFAERGKYFKKLVNEL